MDHCPAEIWSQIFSYACKDDGSTGCSLSLTSKYIRETSKSVRYTSVAIYGVTKISCFYQLLKRGKTSPITYLFISDDEPSGNDARDMTDVLYVSPHGDPVSYPKPMAAMVSDILRSNATSLSSLSIISSSLSLQLFPSIGFPFITDLSLVVSGRTDTALPAPTLPEHLPAFPRLRRLQLANIDNGDMLDQLFSISSSVLHLHITGHRLAPPLDKLPPTIQSIFLKPASSIVDIDPQDYLRWLRNIISLLAETRLWPRTILLKTPVFRAPCNSYEARIAWERTKGGDNTSWESGDSASVDGLLAQLLQAGERFLP